jgi:hypothetical protein
MYKEEGEREECRMGQHERGKNGIIREAALFLPQIEGQHFFLRSCDSAS